LKKEIIDDMRKNNYLKKLKDPRWQKKRLEIMKRDEWKCRFCGDKSTTLNIHHLEYKGEPWESPNEKLITVCEDCHEIIEILKSSLSDTEIENIKIIKHIDNYDISSKMIAVFNIKQNIIISKNKNGSVVVFNMNDKLISKLSQIISIYKSHKK
jgi:hypothetical protein